MITLSGFPAMVGCGSRAEMLLVLASFALCCRAIVCHLQQVRSHHILMRRTDTAMEAKGSQHQHQYGIISTFSSQQYYSGPFRPRRLTQRSCSKPWSSNRSVTLHEFSSLRWIPFGRVMCCILGSLDRSSLQLHLKLIHQY